MSRYDHMSSPGYPAQGHPDHVATPVANMSDHIGRGTHTYVTKIEARFEQVHVPTATGYPLSSPMKMDGFITEVLTKAKGAPVSSIRPRSRPMWDHHSSPKKLDHMKGYGSNYMHGDSPGNLDISKDPYDQRDRTLGRVYDQPPQRDYGDSYVKSDITRDPYDQWGRSPGRICDQPPQRDYAIPNKPWDDTPKKPDMLPGYRVSDNKYSLKPENMQDHGAPNYNWDDSHLKSETPKNYEIPKKQWQRSPQPVYDPAPYNLPSVKSKTSNDNEVPKNKWSNLFMKTKAPRADGRS